MLVIGQIQPLRTALKQYSCERSEPGSTGGTKALHLRRAHHHHYWPALKSSQQKLIVKWLHPMLVGIEKPEQLIPSVRKILPFLTKTGS